MIGVREVILPGLSRVPGDGRKVRFWKDKWLLNRPLIELASSIIPDDMVDASARDLWRNGTGWLSSHLTLFVPSNLRLQLAAVVLNDVTGARDRLSWGESMDGNFSVASAYCFLTRDDSQRQDMVRLFDRVWRAAVSERVTVFLWLAVNQAIMTNMERQRRHLSETSTCQVCKGAEESIIYVFRDCPAIKGIWERLIPIRRQRPFFGKSLMEWIYGNLGDDNEVEVCVWSIMFGITAWWAWKWRCENVFGEAGKWRDRTQFIMEKSKEVCAAKEKLGEGSKVVMSVERLISWSPLREGSVKLNTDDASHGNLGLATAGG